MKNQIQLTIFDTTIKQDSHGRYSLNDIKKSAIRAGYTEDATRIDNWKKTERAKRLIDLLESETTSKSGSLLESKTTVPEGIDTQPRGIGINPINTIEGRKGDTYVVKELVYSYAMYVSTEFELKVIRAFDNLVNLTKQKEISDRIRNEARLNSPAMQDALKFKRELEGKETDRHHYSNEENLIYLVVFGMKAHKFKELNNLGENDSIRDYLKEHNPIALSAIVELLNKNRHYLDDMVEYDERKELLTRFFNRRYKPQMLLD